VDPAGRFIEFHLRSGLKFSDGTPLTAEDVAAPCGWHSIPPIPRPWAILSARTRLPRHRCRFTAARNNSLSEVKAGLERLFDQVYIVPQTGKAKLPPSAGPFFVADYQPGASVC